MPYRATRTHRQHYQVFRDTHLSKYRSRMFDRTYIAEDAYQERWIYAGLIVAVNANNQYVPYHAGAAYGVGSGEAVGITQVPYDMTYGNKAVASVWHGIAIENYCYVYGAGLGNIPTAVKTALDDIQWT